MSHVCQYGEAIWTIGCLQRKECKRPVSYVYVGKNLSYYCCSYHFDENGFSLHRFIGESNLGEWQPTKKYLEPIRDEHKIESITPTHERSSVAGIKFAVKKSAVAAAVSKFESDRAKTFYWDPYFVDGDWW